MPGKHETYQPLAHLPGDHSILSYWLAEIRLYLEICTRSSSTYCIGFYMCFPLYGSTSLPASQALAEQDTMFSSSRLLSAASCGLVHSGILQSPSCSETETITDMVDGRHLCGYFSLCTLVWPQNPQLHRATCVCMASMYQVQGLFVQLAAQTDVLRSHFDQGPQAEYSCVLCTAVLSLI